MFGLLERLVSAGASTWVADTSYSVDMLLPFSRPKTIGTMNGGSTVRMFDLLRVQHAGFPSCLRFSFTRNKLEKSRKPSSPACACLGQIRTQIVANQALAYAEAALRTF